MNIAIDARSVTWSKGTGIGTYTSNIIKEINDININDRYLFFWCDKDYKSISENNIKNVMASKKHTRFFDNIYIPSYLKKNDIELYHIPQNGIGLNESMECIKVVTIHDLIPYIMPETVGKGYLKMFLESMPIIMDLCDAIITVSEYSKSDILKFFPNFPKEKIYVTPLAANSHYKPLNKVQCLNTIQKLFNFDTGYMLYIGGFSERKNVKMIIDSFKECIDSLNLKYKLVIVGSLRDSGMMLKNYCSQINMDDKIIFTGYVDDSLLPILYNGSTAFIYPSLYEGFGLPPLEAMKCGTPVITSNVTSIPEVVDNCGILINPNDITDLSKAIVNLINNDELQDKYSKLSISRSNLYSWHKTALNTIDVYSRLLQH